MEYRPPELAEIVNEVKSEKEEYWLSTLAPNATCTLGSNNVAKPMGEKTSDGLAGLFCEDAQGLVELELLDVEPET